MNRKAGDPDGTGIRKEALEEIRAFARKHQLDKVILFGSRARGDHGRASDIDLAVSGGDILNFTLDVKEEVSTLLTFDIVELEQISKKEFLESINREGILLYEKI